MKPDPRCTVFWLCLVSQSAFAANGYGLQPCYPYGGLPQENTPARQGTAAQSAPQAPVSSPPAGWSRGVPGHGYSDRTHPRFRGYRPHYRPSTDYRREPYRPRGGYRYRPGFPAGPVYGSHPGFRSGPAVGAIETRPAASTAASEPETTISAHPEDKSGPKIPDPPEPKEPPDPPPIPIAEKARPTPPVPGSLPDPGTIRFRPFEQTQATEESIERNTEAPPTDATKTGATDVRAITTDRRDPAVPPGQTPDSHAGPPPERTWRGTRRDPARIQPAFRVEDGLINGKPPVFRPLSTVDIDQDSGGGETTAPVD